MPCTAPVRSPFSSFVPLLKISAAEAPASSAFADFTPKSQVPRWMSAIAPSGKSAKSSGSQPLLLSVSVGSAGARSLSTTTTSWSVTVPDPEKVMVAKSSPGEYVVASGEVCASVLGLFSWKNGNGKVCTFGL